MNNKKIYQALTLNKELKSIAKTDKELAPTLDNINILNDEEYINFMLKFVKMLYESIGELRITGACYLKLLYENNSIRFKDNIFKCLESSCFSVNSWDDYTDVGCMFIIICDLELYKKFLLYVFCTENEEIKADVNESLTDTIDDYKNAPWYKTYTSEYTEFKRKLGLE